MFPNTRSCAIKKPNYVTGMELKYLKEKSLFMFNTVIDFEVRKRMF